MHGEDLIETIVFFSLGCLVGVGIAWTISKKLGWRLPQVLMWLGVVLFTLHIAYSNIVPDAFARSIVDGVLGGKAYSSDMLARYTTVDQDFRKFSESGNVLVRFSGFDATKSRDRDFLTFQYYRATYAAYPRRVYCGEPTNVINNGQDLATIHFDPGDQWLDAHNVATVVQYRVNERDELERDVTVRTNQTASPKALLAPQNGSNR